MARSRKGPTLRFERQRKGKPIGARRLPSYGIRVPRELPWASPGLAPENATARGIQREGHAPGGKSVHWQANLARPSRDMPVESFYRWASDPHLRPVPGTEGQRLILTCTKSRTLTMV